MSLASRDKFFPRFSIEPSVLAKHCAMYIFFFIIFGAIKVGLELFEKYKNPIFSINFRVRQLKLKIHKVNLKY